jgi:hypothetical protein
MVKGLYLHFGMSVDSPVQVSTCSKQFMDAQVYSSQWDTISHILMPLKELDN